MRCVVLLLACVLFFNVFAADDPDALRQQGIEALKESQANPPVIVVAARAFAKASALYEAAGESEKSVEMNSFLYWCKKKMTMADIDAFTKGGEEAVATKITAVEKIAPKAEEAQVWFDRAEKFAQANPSEHLLIAVRFFEVADRFKGSDASLKAQDRSLKEQVQAAAGKAAAAPVAVAAPKTAPANIGSQPVPPTAKIKEAEKVVKDLFKADYAKTDAPGQLALAAKLLQQADENKDDAASSYVLLREARNLFVAAGDSEKALATHKRLCATFNLDFSAIMDDLKPLDAAAKTEPRAAALAAIYSAAAGEALEADNFDQAVRFQLHTDELLAQIKVAALKSQLKAEIDTAKAMKRDSVAALAALNTLKSKPDDPEANLTAGRFALERGRFDAAFPLLAKGKDAGLSALAKRELVPPREASEQVVMADEWYARGEKELYNYLKEQMHKRAAFWYANAFPALTGLAKVKAEGRMKALAVTPPEKAAPILSKVDKAPPTTGKKPSENWISEKASYTVSAPNMTFPPSPRLLNGKGGGHDFVGTDHFAFMSKGTTPSIIIDLNGVSYVYALEIKNRRNDHTDKCNTLTIWSSTEAEGPWSEIWRAEKSELEWNVQLLKPVPARFIKIGLREDKEFTLFSVKVFGEQTRDLSNQPKTAEIPQSKNRIETQSKKGLALTIGETKSIWLNRQLDNLPDKTTPVSLTGFLILPEKFKTLRLRSATAYGSERLKMTVGGEELAYERSGQTRTATLPDKQYPRRVEFEIGKSIAATPNWKWGPLEWSIDDGKWTLVPLENLEPAEAGGKN